MALNEIKRYRKLLGLTQRELAEKCGLATGTIQQYELGKRKPKIEQLQKIANALNVPVKYLLEPLNIGLMTVNDYEKIEYALSNNETDIQSLFLQNGYSLIKLEDSYIMQKMVDGIHGKRIQLTPEEFYELTKDIDFFIKYLAEKLFNSHDYYFDDSKS